MKRVTAVLLVASVIAACGVETDGEEAFGEVVQSDLARELDPQIAPADVETQVAANNAFATDLYAASVADGTNMIASPYSASVALAMTYAGARDGTADEMANVLHYDLPQASLHPALNYLDLLLESHSAEATDGTFRLRIANAIWGLDGYPFEQDFLDTIALNYGAGLRTLDFIDDPNGSRKTINLWVEKETDQKIVDLLPDRSITRGTRLVLTNAIYFNAEWFHPFEEDATTSEPFELADGTNVDTEMMHQLADHKYARIGTADVVEMMYEGNDVSMVVIVPDDLAAFETDEFDAAFLGQLSNELEPKTVDLAMPKFEVETTLPLTETLQEMGMVLPFSESMADFSGISSTGDRLFITTVIQKAFVMVNEEGTEAAAATAVVVGNNSVPVADVAVRADKPFIYLIRDVETGTVLFMGRFVDPR